MNNYRKYLHQSSQMMELEFTSKLLLKDVGMVDSAKGHGASFPAYAGKSSEMG